MTDFCDIIGDGNNPVIIQFCGRKRSQEEFSEEFNAIMERLVESGMNVSLWRILWEIVKNIYDHNGGWGYLRLHQAGDGGIEFEVGNSTPPPDEGLVLDSGYNSGVGLGSDGKTGLIFAYAFAIGLQLVLDVPQGYVFNGILKKQNS